MMKYSIQSKELIENKEISSYQINKDTGISYGNINAMRRGERRIENLSLKNAKILYEYAKRYCNITTFLVTNPAI